MHIPLQLRILLLLILFPVPVLFAESLPVSIGFEFDFASGSYGGDQTSESIQVPLRISVYPGERFDFEVVIPYIYQSDSSTLIMGGGRYPRMNASGGSGTMSGMGMGPGDGGSTTTDSQSGLGDISLTAGYSLLRDGESMLNVRPIFYVKFPSGDEERGLGSGATDIGAGLDIAKQFGRWGLSGEVLYVAPGSSSTVDPDDYLNYSFFLRRYLKRFDVGIGLLGGTAPFAGNEDPLEAGLDLNLLLSPQLDAGAFYDHGLSDGSADYSVGFYLTRHF